MSKTFIATSAVIGTVIGAGVLGIPYVVMKSGFPIGMIHLVLVGLLVTLLMLYLGEVTLRTKQNHQLTGYASKYLGPRGRKIMLLAFIFEVFSALVAYMLGQGESFSHLLFGSAQYSIYLAVGFWLFMTIFTYFGLKALEEGESIGVILMLIMFISAAVYAWNKIDVLNISYIELNNWFVPFGVIIFAFLGFTIIPELERIAGEHHKKIVKRSIILGMATCFVAYTVFALAVIGIGGKATPEIATILLGKPFIFLGIFTMFTSYLALATAFIDTLRFDFRKNKITAWAITSIIPLTLYIILKFTSNVGFTKVLSIGGIISGGLMAILILFMVEKAKKFGDDKPAYSIPYHPILKWIISTIFIVAIVLEIIKII